MTIELKKWAKARWPSNCPRCGRWIPRGRPVCKIEEGVWACKKCADSLAAMWAEILDRKKVTG